MGLLKRFWQHLALVAGVGLILFELLKPQGLRGDSWFWLIVGGLIVVLAGLDIWQRWTGSGGGSGEPGDDRTD